MKFSKYHLAVLALILTSIIWGASSAIFRWSLESISPLSFAFLRFFLASLILLPFTIRNLKITHHDLISLFVLSVVGFVLQIGLILIGLSISTSINSSVILTSAPIFLILGSIYLFREKVTNRVVFGTIISLLGVITIILRPLFDQGLDGTITGNLLFLLSTLALVCYTLLLKHYVTHLKTTTVTFYLFGIAAIIFFPFFLADSGGKSILQSLTIQASIGILFGAVFTSIFGYLFYNYGIKVIKSSEVGIFLYIDPIVTALVAVPLLHEKITITFLLGTILVFVGIFVAEKRLHYHPFHFFFRKS